MIKLILNVCCHAICIHMNIGRILDCYTPRLCLMNFSRWNLVLGLWSADVCSTFIYIHYFHEFYIYYNVLCLISLMNTNRILCAVCLTLFYLIAFIWFQRKRTKRLWCIPVDITIPWMNLISFLETHSWFFFFFLTSNMSEIGIELISILVMVLKLHICSKKYCKLIVALLKMLVHFITQTCRRCLVKCSVIQI